MSLCKSIASSAVAIVVSIDSFQPLHLFYYLHCILLNQSLVGEDVLLLSAAVQVRARQDVRNSPESGEKILLISLPIPDHDVCIPVEQHGNELDDDDGEEEEHEDNSDWLKVQILFGDNDLGKGELLLLEPNSCMQFLFIGSLCYISC